MKARMAVDDLATDAVFPLEGQALPREHAQALQQALCAILPWLESDPIAGIHPVKLVPGSAVPALLSRRARLLLRVASRRMDELVALARAQCQLQHDADWQAVAVIAMPDRREVWRVQSSGFEDWLRAAYWRARQAGVTDTTMKAVRVPMETISAR